MKLYSRPSSLKVLIHCLLNVSPASYVMCHLRNVTGEWTWLDDNRGTFPFRKIYVILFIAEKKSRDRQKRSLKTKDRQAPVTVEKTEKPPLPEKGSYFTQAVYIYVSQEFAQFTVKSIISLFRFKSEVATDRHLQFVFTFIAPWICCFRL